MYVIKLNGSALYSPAMMDMSRRVLAPKATLDINGNGSCSFVLPPGNVAADKIRRRKSIITVEQDGQEIFRGRVMDDVKDTYNQKSIYCEGVRGYLNDSQAAPYTYKGTPRGLLLKLITEHNEQIEEDKRFTLGEITIDRADEALECENVAYWETLKEIDEKLLSAYGGYLRARKEGGILYLDWVKEYGRANPQKIRFAVNLLELKDKRDTADMFTILRPLGASAIGDDGEISPPLTIASVNGGSEIIQDDEAIDDFGRIYKTKTWAYIEDPAQLLEKAKEYLKIGAELRTITLRAIDMHFLDGSAQAIQIGDTVHIHSLPHGIDIEKVCSKIEIDIANPENTLYTFGEARKALTDNFVTTEETLETLTGGGGGKSVKEEMTGIIRWAQVKVDAANANIQLLTGEANSLDNRLSKAEIELDGINAQILLKASREEVDALGMRMSAAEVEIDGANAEILLKANKTDVDDLGKRMSAAEVEIDGINSEILLKANKIDLQGYVTASQFSTLESNVANLTTGTTQASHLYTQNLTATNTVRLAGYTCVWKKMTVVTGVSLSKTYQNVPGGNGVTYTVIGGVSLSKDTEEIKYFGRD